MRQSVYSSLKPLHFPERLSALGTDQLPAPIHVRIKPTNVCNHGCYFCAYRSDNVSLGEDIVVRDKIPRAKMIEIVDDLIEMGVKAVTFSGGGEPLIYPHLAQAVTRLAQGGIKVGALTNGSRLMSKVADVLAAQATWIRVSIDGWDAESYAAYRNTRQSEFGRVMENLSAFAKRGSACVLGASIIVDEHNAAHIYELAARLRDCGVRHAKVSPCIVSNGGAENNAYHRRFRERVRAELERARALCDHGFQIVDHYHDLAERFEKSYRSCPFVRLLTVIGADCMVYSCQDKAYTKPGKLGSIRERRFREFWFSEDNRQALTAINPADLCRHHCVADAKNRLIHDYLSLDPEHLGFV